MAKKKGGGGGADASKKTIQKKKQQVIDDKTFGLKNKNKSKKVQQHVQSVRNNVMNSGDKKQRQLEEQRSKAKAEAKLRRKAQKDEQDALFGEALMAIQKKKTTSQASGKVEAKGRDADADEGKKSTSRAMKMMYQMDAQEMSDKLREDPNYVPTLEDEIELQRQAKVAQLKASGKKGTPVTEASFKAWQDLKRKKHELEAKKRVEAEFKKKKGGKGLAVLTGRDLYTFKRDLFEHVEEQEAAEDAAAAAAAAAAGGETTQTNGTATASSVDAVAATVQSELFLEGDDDDLDDLDDD